MTNGYSQNGRPIAEVLHEVTNELKDFLSTRIQMLRTEMSEKLSAWKLGLPSMIIGVVLMWTAFLALTAGLISAIALAFGSAPWAIAVSCFIVMAVYGLMGALLLSYGWKTASSVGIAPDRTIKVLQQDKVWLQTEARTQL